MSKKRASRYISTKWSCPKYGSGDTYLGTETADETTGMVGVRDPNTGLLFGRTFSRKKDRTVTRCKNCDSILSSKDELGGGYTEYKQDDGSWARKNPDYTSEDIEVIVKIVVSLILAMWGVSGFEEAKDDTVAQALFGVLFFGGSYFCLSMLGLVVSGKA
jgi:hypothetical protein